MKKYLVILNAADDGYAHIERMDTVNAWFNKYKKRLAIDSSEKEESYISERLGMGLDDLQWLVVKKVDLEDTEIDLESKELFHTGRNPQE